MSSIPFRDAIIFRFPAVGYSALPKKLLFPHRWLWSVEWIKAKKRISYYYFHFIQCFMIFFLASFSTWPTFSDRSVGENVSIYIPTVFGLFKLLTSGSSPLCICLSYLWFEMEWLAVPTPCRPIPLVWTTHVEVEWILICTRVQHQGYSLWIGWTRHTLVLVALKLH